MLSLDPTFLLISLIPSGIGFVLFVYGRKQQRWPQIVGGILMMVYPYFVNGSAMLVIVGLAICAAVWAGLRMGW